MAGRNKKGKLHSIFSQEFDVTFYHKPPMDSSEYMYFIVLEDVIMLQARFINNAVLVIESAKSFTTSMMYNEYVRLVNHLKSCETITVLVSAIGCCQELIQACIANNIPAVESTEFLIHPSTFYTKYKTYTHNDETKFGFYLLSFDEKSFKETKDILNHTTSDSIVVLEQSLSEPLDTPAPVIEPPDPKKITEVSSIAAPAKPEHPKSKSDFSIRRELIPLVDSIKKIIPDMTVTPYYDFEPNAEVDNIVITEVAESNHTYNAMSINAQVVTDKSGRTIVKLMRISDGCMIMKYMKLLDVMHALASGDITYMICEVSQSSQFHDMLSYSAYCTEVPRNLFDKPSYIIK